MSRVVPCNFVLLSLFLTVGCGSADLWPSAYPGVTLRGGVHGGQQPISGASIQLYAVGTAFDGSPATPLLSKSVVTGSSGGFNITGDYGCPSASSLVYLVAAGGNPGVGSANPNSVLAAALGPCGALSSASFIAVDEVTTVGSLMPLGSLATTFSAIGSSYADEGFLSAAFAEVNNLVNISTGLAPGSMLQAGLTAPLEKINTLADIIASCVNSTGGKAGDGSACGNLFAYATPPGGTAPSNTADALIDISQNPNENLRGLFNLAMATSPYQPALPQAPTSWAVLPTPAVPAHNTLLGEYLLTEGSGSTAHDTSGNGNDGTILGPTWETSNQLNFTASGQYISLPSTLNTAQTWQFAMYQPTFGYAQLPLAPGYGDPSSLPFNPSILCGTDESAVCLNSGSSAKANAFQAFNTDGTQSATPLPSGWHIVTFVCGTVATGVGRPAHILYDGVEVSSYTVQGTATCPAPKAGQFQIGGSSLYTGTWFMGKVAAAWAWSTSLSVSDASAAAATALAYIKSKGVVTQFANAGNPTPLLLAGMDSRTVGYGLNSTSEAWPYMIQLDQALTRINLASAGEQTIDGCAQFDLVYGQQIPLNPTSPVIVVIWGGVNDINFDTDTPAQIAANLQCMVQKAKADGALVVLATEISSESPSGPEGDKEKDALDPIIRANAFSWGVDNIADLATNPALGADGASASTTCFYDTLHPATACEPYVTAIMQDAINELLGSTESSPHQTSAVGYQELAGDRFLTLTGTGTQTVTLPSCIGYSLSRHITNSGQSAAALASAPGELLTGGTTIGTGTEAIIAPVPGPVSVGGCSWSRVQ